MRIELSLFPLRAASFALTLVLASVAVPAAPLDGAVCRDLDAQQKQFELTGIKDDLAKDPAWAKANLSAGRLEAVKQYIEVKEQVSFRCPSLVVVSVPELAEPEAKAPEAAPAKAADAKPAKASSKKKKHKTIQIEVPAPAKKATTAE